MSLILPLTRKSNVLATTYFPAIDLSDDDYELGLMNFETYNTISNLKLVIPWKRLQHVHDDKKSSMMM